MPIIYRSVIVSAVLAVALLLTPAVAAAQKLPTGASSFEFIDERGNADRPLTVWTYLPDNARPDSPVVFVMHGVRRNGREYRDNWIEHAKSKRFLLIVPEFSEKDYPREAYQQGNIIDAGGNPVDVSRWSFTAIDIEHLFDHAKKLTRNTSRKYYLYGHSGGGQFVQRFVMFMPQPRCAGAIAANPGYYITPETRERVERFLELS